MIKILTLMEYCLMPQGAIEAIKVADTVIIQSKKAAAYHEIAKISRNIVDLDSFFEEAPDFDALYKCAAQYISELAENCSVVFCTLGNISDNGFVKELQKTQEVQIVSKGCRVEQAVHMAEPIVGEVGDYSLISAENIGKRYLDTSQGIVIRDINSAFTAINVKLALLDYYSPETLVAAVQNGSAQSCRIESIDRITDYTDGVTLVIGALLLEEKTVFTYNDLLEVMKKLRSPNGCPWDGQQTHESLRQYLLEEAYEVMDAVDLKDMDALYDELGDVLLQVVFHAEIARQCGEFTHLDVTSAICSKMIKRHPHIFADGNADTPDAVVKKWEEIKREEKGNDNFVSVLKDVPKSMGALMRAYKLQKKASAIGFDWPDAISAFEKIREETEELYIELTKGNLDAVEEEAGDLLFSIVNVLRKQGINPEVALTGMCEKFISRFEYIESKAGGKLFEMSLEKMDSLWTDSKNSE